MRTCEQTQPNPERIFGEYPPIQKLLSRLKRDGLKQFMDAKPIPILIPKMGPRGPYWIRACVVKLKEGLTLNRDCKLFTYNPIRDVIMGSYETFRLFQSTLPTERNEYENL